jgi:diguanylate cyclase (GGDEF)-like protein
LRPYAITFYPAETLVRKRPDRAAGCQMMNGKIIIVDQDIAFAEKMAKMLDVDRLSVFSLVSGKQVLSLIQNVGIDVVICGRLASDHESLDLLRNIKEISPSTETILLHPSPSVELLEGALKWKAFRFLKLPFEEKGELNRAVLDALEKKREFIKNKNLIDDLLKKNQELLEAHHLISSLHQDTEALYYFGRCLATSLNLEEIYAMMINAANKLLHNRPTMLFLFNEEKSLFYVKKSIGFRDSPPSDIILPVGPADRENMLKWFEKEEYRDSLTTRLSQIAECHSILSKPIIIHNKVFGFLTILQSRDSECTEREVNIFKQFISQSAFVLENAFLHEMANALANRDELTGAFNRRYFQERIEEEIKRCGRMGSVFSLMILDVDHFKKYNDTFGHIQGDHLLKEIVAGMKTRLRTTDVICRFGGDEFLVLLMETDRELAISIGNQIRSIIEQNPAFYFCGEAENKITFSLGIAQYPDDGLTSIDLIRKADNALYLAKARGRNQVVA